MLKILFMGTPDFARDSLSALYEANYEIIGVVTNPDRPKGRGMKMVISPVKEFAIEHNLQIYQPENVKNNSEFVQKIKELKPDIICVVAYGKILPVEILNIPKLGCINLHGSILPKYRGAAPIQWAVINGDKKTGVTTIYMDEGMDSGDIILNKTVDIDEYETTGELWDRLSKVGANLLVETIKRIENKTAPRQKQGNEYTLAPMLNKDMAKIDWEKMTTEQIKNLVRGLDPIIGAYTIYNDKKLKIWKTKINTSLKYAEKKPGEILISDSKNGLTVKTLDGAIDIIEIQGENGKRMSINDFLRGNPINENGILK